MLAHSVRTNKIFSGQPDSTRLGLGTPIGALYHGYPKTHIHQGDKIKMVNRFTTLPTQNHPTDPAGDRPTDQPTENLPEFRPFVVIPPSGRDPCASALQPRRYQQYSQSSALPLRFCCLPTGWRAGGRHCHYWTGMGEI